LTGTAWLATDEGRGDLGAVKEGGGDGEDDGLDEEESVPVSWWPGSVHRSLKYLKLKISVKRK
jgi:hypothetical protein